jgi:hypothetical protein
MSSRKRRSGGKLKEGYTVVFMWAAKQRADPSNHEGGFLADSPVDESPYFRLDTFFLIKRLLRVDLEG